MNSFIGRLNKGQQRKLIYLVRGKDQGRAAWYYVRVNNTHVLPLFLKDVDSGSPDLQKYSVILDCGWGEDPPPDIKKRYEGASE
jgi:hypothetical protein